MIEIMKELIKFQVRFKNFFKCERLCEWIFNNFESFFDFEWNFNDDIMFLR